MKYLTFVVLVVTFGLLVHRLLIAKPKMFGRHSQRIFTYRPYRTITLGALFPVFFISRLILASAGSTRRDSSIKQNSPLRVAEVVMSSDPATNGSVDDAYFVRFLLLLIILSFCEWVIDSWRDTASTTAVADLPKLKAAGLGFIGFLAISVCTLFTTNRIPRSMLLVTYSTFYVSRLLRLYAASEASTKQSVFKRSFILWWIV
jgi:hypothetical protein